MYRVEQRLTAARAPRSGAGRVAVAGLTVAAPFVAAVLGETQAWEWLVTDPGRRLRPMEGPERNRRGPARDRRSFAKRASEGARGEVYPSLRLPPLASMRVPICSSRYG